MKRVLVACLKHEANTFAPGNADLDTFRHFHLREGDAVLAEGPSSGDELSGVMEVAAAEGIELIPTIDAAALAAPPVLDLAYEYLRDRILDGARRHRAHLDGVILNLHGAMTTVRREDPEGELIAAVRDIVGPRIPISVSFDMHCHFTPLKASGADAIVGYHTHPHVDFVDTGARAMRILARALRAEASPVVAYRKLRMIAPAERHNTSRPPMHEVMARILEIEKEPGILAATVFATQPWMDVVGLSWAFVVVADGDLALAQSRADELASMAWDHRELFRVKRTPIPEAVGLSLAGTGRPYVLADSSDSPSGGALGDGNCLLRHLLEAGCPESTIMTVTDAEAVAACYAAGVGAEVTTTVGGRLTTAFYSPVRVTGKVKSLANGQYQGQLPRGPIDVGRVAVLDIGNISVLLSERPAPTMDIGAYVCAGLDPRAAKMVQVKSPGGFRAYYGPFAAGIFELDAPGPSDSDVTRLPYTRITRPLWPFDPDVKDPW